MASLKHYLLAGGKYGLLSLLLAGVLYIVLILRPWKKRELDNQGQIKWFLSLWYILALTFTVFGNRSPFIQTSNFHPFNALWEALTSPDWHAAIQLTLNVLSFVPLGLLLVWHAQKLKKIKMIYLLTILLPLLIECTQYITRLGTMDIDDLLANSFGALWGLFLGLCYVHLLGRKPLLVPALGALLPVVLLSAGLLCLSIRPYGFIRQDFPDYSHGKPQEVSTAAIEGQVPTNVTVYQLVSPPGTDAALTADRLFGALGLTRNVDFSDVYDDLAVYRVAGSNEYLWYYYTGDFDLFIPNGLPVEGTIEETVTQLLKRAGYTLPDPSEVEADHMVWHFVSTSGLLFDGEILVKESGGSLTEISARVHALQPYTECVSLDMEGLQNALQHGHFSILSGPNDGYICKLECQNAEITWVIDGKRCYHPLLRITCLINDEPSQILAPVF